LRWPDLVFGGLESNNLSTRQWGNKILGAGNKQDIQEQ
jgi:hypothetical protein